MIRLLIPLTTVIICANGATLPKFKDARDIEPKQIGLYHNEALERLGERYLSREPENLQAVLKDLVDIMSSYCLNDECEKIASESIYEQFLLYNKNVEDVIPHDFDPTVKKYLKSFESTILSIDEKDVGEVVFALSLLQDNLEDADCISEEHKTIGLSAGSIAIESTKLWSEVFNNPDHPLNNIYRSDISLYDSNFPTRKLEDEDDWPEPNLSDDVYPTTANVGLVILMDFLGFLMFPIFPFFSITVSYIAWYFLRIGTPYPSMAPTLTSLPTLTNPPTTPTSAPIVG